MIPPHPNGGVRLRTSARQCAPDGLPPRSEPSSAWPPAGTLGVVTGVVGPIIALLVVAFLALILRWSFGSTQMPGPVPDRRGADFGLLHEVAVVGSVGEADTLRGVLSDAEIRSTTADAGWGRVRVLVFAADLELARALVGPGSTF